MAYTSDVNLDQVLISLSQSLFENAEHTSLAERITALETELGLVDAATSALEDLVA
jgi:hypothetical protein